jgi:hypothetical protein
MNLIGSFRRAGFEFYGNGLIAPKGISVDPEILLRALGQCISQPVNRLFGLSGGYAVAMWGMLVLLAGWLSCS